MQNLPGDRPLEDLDHLGRTRVPCTFSDHEDRAGQEAAIGGGRLAGTASQQRYCALRKVTTARTRRWSSGDGGKRSVAKMFLTCFSTVCSVTNSRSAIALLDRPSAISPSTSRSRSVSCSSAPLCRLGLPTNWLTTAGSSTEPPSPTWRTLEASPARSDTRSLSR